MNRSNLTGQTLLNQYFVRELIGVGGMGQVYSVWDKKRSTLLVIKTLHSELGEDPNILRRFEREAKTLSNLQHPNIVRFYGYYRTGDLSFMIMDFVDGKSLKEIARNKIFSLQELLEVTKPVCNALNYAHAHGIVHGDIKPGNILINKQGFYFLSDFGLARLKNESAGAAGTPAYMAPEQIRGEVLSPQTDIYSLGIVIYELLTGRRPFDREKDLRNLFDATINLEPPDPKEFNPSIPNEVVDALMIALKKDPKHRYQNVQSFCATIEKAIKKQSSTPIEVVRDTQSSPTKNESTSNDKIERKESIKKLDFLIPLKQEFRFVSEPLQPSQNKLLIGRNNEIDQLSSRLLYSNGGAFLIAGYRGAGKTSFINQVLNQVSQQIIKDDGEERLELVIVKLNIPKSIPPVELMYLVIRGLYQKLNELKLYRLLEKELADDINLAIQRISSDLEQKTTISNDFEIGSSLGHSQVTGISASAKRNRGTEMTRKYRDYHISAAEQDLLSVLGRLQAPIFRTRKVAGLFKRKPQEIFLKVIIVFDELDRIDDYVALTDLLTSLKTLFTTSGVSFIFVAGKDFYAHWLKDLRQTDSSFEGIFSGFDLYLPCLWDNVSDIVDTVVETDTANWKDLSSQISNLNTIYEDFLGYLSFKGRGIPRRIQRVYSMYVVLQQSKAYFGFTRQDARRFRFYAELQDWLISNEPKFISTYFDSLNIERDNARITLHAIIDWILYYGNKWFSLEDLVKAHDLNENIMSQENRALDTLLEQLTLGEYLEKSDKGYRLNFRRYIEIGERPEKIINDEVSVVEQTGSGLVMLKAYSDIDEADNTNYAVSYHPQLETNLSNSVSNKTEIDVKLIAFNNKLSILKQTNKKNIILKSESIIEKLDIGRSRENDIQLLEDFISRYHARIIFIDGNWYIYDMNTINNTLLNDTPIQEKQSLFSGDIIKIGKTSLTFKISGSSKPPLD